MAASTEDFNYYKSTKKYSRIWLELLFFDKFNQYNYLFDRCIVRQGETSPRCNLHASINLSKNLYNLADGSNSM